MKRLLNKYLPILYGAYFNSLAFFSKKGAAKKAFKTFCTIRKGRILPSQVGFLEQVKDDTLTVHGHTLQPYKWPGSGETVLLVHGWESNSFRWRNLIKFLREEKFNIVAFDAPGHGHSTGTYLHVPLYTECLQSMIEKYNPDYIVAHSVGGMTAMYHQHKYPDSKIEKIVTIGSPSEFHEIMAHFQKLLKLSSRVMEALNDYVIENFGFEIRDFSTSKFAKTNTKRGLLFHDRLDKLAPFHASEQVHTNWKDSIFVATEGLGHSMHQDEINQQIVDFLKS